MESPPLREKILVVDDVAENVSVLAATLEPRGYEICTASNGVSALKIAARARPDLILLDLMMPGLDGLETCRRLRENGPARDIPIIFISARTEVESLVQAFEAGGVDYIIKPFEPREVLSRIETHLRVSRLTRELQEKNRSLEARTAELAAEIEHRRTVETALRSADEQLAAWSDLEAGRWDVAGLVGNSRHLRRITDDIARLHQFPNTGVLITGESGTGKELVARAIHFQSSRARAPFVPLNCVAVPADLAESILFGHVKGAFTGAISDRKGCFELAHGGTLFLDEIGDMPVALQVKLLRILEDGCVTPVGAASARTVDVRVIAATNADLESRIESGTFRQDLYFRLARYVVTTPPLRERPEDIPLLASHFLRRFAGDLGMAPPALHEQARAALQAYEFPGNIRELKNVIERALIQSGGRTIETIHLQLSKRPVANPGVSGTRKSERAASLPLNLAEAEDLLIQRALQTTGGNIADAARLLGIHRTRIYRKLAREETVQEE